MSVPRSDRARTHSSAALLLLLAAAIGAGIVLATWDDRGLRTPVATQPSARVGADAMRGPARDTAVDGDRQPVADAAAVAERTLLCGTVRLVETGEPVNGGSIEARYVDCRAGGEKAESLVGADPDTLACEQATCAVAATGRYELPLPAGAFLVALTVEPPEAVDVSGLRFSVRFDAFARRKFAIGMAASGVIWARDLEVTRGARLTGVVLESTHRTPLPGALVTCASASSVFEPFGAHTNAAGTFAVCGLPAEADSDGDTWTARISCSGYVAREVTVRCTDPAGTDITVVLERGVVLAGRVVDPQGNGVADANVAASAELAGEWDLGRRLAYSLTFRTGADGGFEFSVPPAEVAVVRADGQYRLAADPEQWVGGAARIANLDGRRSATDLRLELQPLARFHVRAFYPGGEAVPEDGLSVARDGVFEGPWFSAPAGVAIEIEVFAPKSGQQGSPNGVDLAPTSTAPAIAYRGRATCVAQHTAGAPTEVDVALDAWEFTVAPPLPPPGDEQVTSLTLDSRGAHLACVRDLTFVDAVTGRTLASTRAGFEMAGGGGYAWTSSRGRLRLALAPGPLELTISVDGFEPRLVRVQNRMNSYEPIEVRMQPQR